MTLLAPGAAAYEPTAEDELTLLRAVAAEGKPEPMVARALVNLFMMARSKGSTQSLATLVKAYAQPINPRWFPDGDLHKAALAKGKDTAAAAKARLTKAKRQHPFPQTTVAAVKAALTSAYAGDVTDYAAPTLDASKKGYAARSDAMDGWNRLWSRAPGWDGYSVTAVASAGGALLVVIAVLAFAALSRRA